MEYALRLFFMIFSQVALHYWYIVLIPVYIGLGIALYRHSFIPLYWSLLPSLVVAILLTIGELNKPW